MQILQGTRVKANKAEILKALGKNRETHRKIVQEAREGYVKAARKALEEKLAKVKAGKIVHLHFRLAAPQDYTEVYDTAIKMLELHQGDTIDLEASQVRCLVMNEWDWQQHFITSNAMYSSTARSMSRDAESEDEG